ncbi:MAG: hypothetical protein AAFV93_10650 [Chloroflexota bacterium]
MAYELAWHIEDQALLLTISGHYTLLDARDANKHILDMLEKSSNTLALLIDATTMQRPYNFGEIRATQHYMDHQRLDGIYVATRDRLIKLSMMVIFNLSRANLFIADDVINAENMLRQRLKNA